MLYPRKKWCHYFQDIQEKKSVIIKKLTSKYKGQKQTGINILKCVVDICSDNIETLQFKNGIILVTVYAQILTSLSNHVILVLLILLYSILKLLYM